MKNVYVTTPIYYVNDKPHIGHAYTSVAADVIARFFTIMDAKTKLTTGTDEHGQKVFFSAQKKQISAQKFVDNISKDFKDLAQTINIKYSDFIRTTELRHKKTAEIFWNKLVKNGYIYLDKYSGWYCQRDEAFYQKDELIDGNAPTGAPVEWVEEESYFFRLSHFGEKLLQFYQDNPNFILPKNRQNEVLAFVRGGLRDLSVSRLNLEWGIKTPGDHNHTMYVWLDALVNYLSSVNCAEPENEEYKNFWQNANVIHVIGKDILRFHAVYWPAFLMAADLPLPNTILTHGWWTNEGVKISKSLGNTIDPIALLHDFDVDAIRYFLMKEVPFGNDGNFSVKALKMRVNADLANNIGNLIQRTLTLIVKNCDSEIPQYQNLDPLVSFAYRAFKKFKQSMEKFEFASALDVVLQISSKANEYIDTHAPWLLAKTDKQKMYNVLYNLAETIRCIGIMLQPFTPESANRILNSICATQNSRSFFAITCDDKLQSGTKILNPQPIFSRYQ